MKQNRTRAAIADAFTRLLAEHTIDQITVRMITDEVGCSRKTFYYYFTDIFDLTKYVSEQRISAFLAADSRGDNAAENLLALMKYMYAERSVVLNLFHGYGKDALESFVWQTIEDHTRRLISVKSEVADLSEEDRETLIRLYAYMVYGMLVDWLNSEMNADCTKTMDLAVKTLPRFIEGLKKE